MADAPTYQDLFDAGRREVLVQPTRISNDVVDIAGSDANIIVASSAAQADEIAGYALALYQESFLGTAQGQALDRWINDRYQLPRQAAVPAVVLLRFDRGGTVGFTIPAGSIFSTDDGVDYSTIDDVVFAASQEGPLFVTANATQAGTIGNVPIAAVTTVQDTFDDDTLTVTNEEPAAGGADDESDDDYRARARDFFLSVRRGTKRAIETGARSVAGVQEATASEVLDPDTGNPFFRVQLLFSDLEGQGNLALGDRILLALDEFRGLGVPVSLIAGTPQLQSIVATGLLFEAGFSTTTVLNNARAAIVSAVNLLAPNETLRRAVILSALDTVDGLIVPDDALVEPAGDVVPNAGQVIRTQASLVNLSG